MIYIVEDDSSIRELEQYALQSNGYETTGCEDAASFWAALRSGRPDLVILDVMLPEMSGFEVCRRLHREKNVALMMVTALRDDVDKIRGLGLGADDYVVKPFSPSELTARVKAHIATRRRLLGKKREEVLAARDLKIMPLSRRVFLKAREISLTKREYDVLLFLASHPDRVFSREQLFERVWGEDALGDTATVTVHVNRLREKIETDPSRPEYIETVWGVGYRFMGH